VDSFTDVQPLETNSGMKVKQDTSSYTHTSLPTIQDKNDNFTEDIMRKLFQKYGHDNVLTLKGFINLLRNLGLSQIHMLEDGEGHVSGDHARLNSRENMEEIGTGNQSHELHVEKTQNESSVRVNSEQVKHNVNVPIDHISHEKNSSKVRDERSDSSERVNTP